ncbi:MAG: cell division protein FtsL [Myxococcota bacterium]
MSNAPQRRTRGPKLSWRVGRFFAFLGLMIIVVGTGIYQVHQRHRLIQLGYVLDDARFEQRQLLETNKRLNLALSAHKDPNAVKTIATDRLGMRAATQTDEFRVPSDKAVEVVDEEALNAP